MTTAREAAPMTDTPPARVPLRDRWRALRDRLLSDPRFHRFAAAFAPTRPFARHESRALFDIVAGFTYSQVLFACVRLRLFEILAEGPQTPAVLARRLSLPEDGAQRLLAAAASLRLIDARSGGRWGLGPLGAPIVAQPAIAAMVEHHARLYQDLADPIALLRGERGATALAGYWPYADTAPGAAPEALPAERVAEYSALMSASQPLVAEQVLDAYPLRRHRCLLDVGGGEGRFLAAAAARAPSLQLMLFDLPAVAERARERLAEQGLADRVRVHGGSFFTDPLPRGADVITLVRVLFDHPDERVLTLLRAVRAALPADGVLLVSEPMSGTPGAEAIGDAYYGLYLLAMGRGRSRTPARIEALLAEAGFDRIRLLPTQLPLQTRVLIAHPARG
jgi:demethylspheroidene O-methyltransferase